MIEQHAGALFGWHRLEKEHENDVYLVHFGCHILHAEKRLSKIAAGNENRKRTLIMQRKGELHGWKKQILSCTVEQIGKKTTQHNTQACTHTKSVHTHARA